MVLDEAARAGTVLAGRYRLEKLIGSGGFADVYRARDELDGGDVAIKLLHPHLTRNSATVERFLREARAAASIEHARVVRVLGTGKDDDTLYIALEYAPGHTLARHLAMRDRFPLAKAVDYVGQVLEGLAAAHAAGVVHRDVKPENVMVGPDGRCRLMDFGMAHAPGRGATLTQTGAALGTPHYMAPEQARGETVDHRADLYAAGVLLFVLVTGKVPFDAPTPLAILNQHMKSRPPRASSLRSGLPPEIEDFLERALAKRPERRFESADEMRAALLALGEATNRPVTKAASREYDAGPPADRADGGATIAISGQRSALASLRLDALRSIWRSWTAPKVDASSSTQPRATRDAAGPGSKPLGPTRTSRSWAQAHAAGRPRKSAPGTGRDGVPRSALAWLTLVLTAALVIVVGAAYLALRTRPEFDARITTLLRASAVDRTPAVGDSVYPAVADGLEFTASLGGWVTGPEYDRRGRVGMGSYVRFRNVGTSAIRIDPRFLVVRDGDGTVYPLDVIEQERPGHDFADRWDAVVLASGEEIEGHLEWDALSGASKQTISYEPPDSRPLRVLVGP